MTDTQITVRATAHREHQYGPTEWLRVIHKVNGLRPGTFGAPISTGDWWAGGYVEEYVDARVILDTDAEGHTSPDSSARIVSKTPEGAVVLAQAARILGIEVSS